MSALDFNTGWRGRYLLCKDPRQVGKPQAGLHLCFRPDAVGWQFGGPWPYQKRATANEQRYWCLSGRVIHPRGRGDVWGAWSVLSHNRLLHVCVAMTGVEMSQMCHDMFESILSGHLWWDIVGNLVRLDHKRTVSSFFQSCLQWRSANAWSNGIGRWWSLHFRVHKILCWARWRSFRLLGRIMDSCCCGLGTSHWWSL